MRLVFLLRRRKKNYEQGIVSLRTFAGLEEDRKAVRQVLQSDFGLHPSGNLALRSDIALLLCVWESARTQLSVQEKNRQESKLGMQQRIVQPSDYATMRSAVEAKHGRLKDREAPSKGMIASKLEQVEDGAPIAEDLREVTSFADSEVEAYNAIIASLTPQWVFCAFALARRLQHRLRPRRSCGSATGALALLGIL